MKSFSKIASVILALVMMLTVCVMPTSAASDTELDITYTVAKDAEKSNEQYDVYGLTISVQAGKNNIAMLNIPIVYDLTKFTPSSMNAAQGGTIKYTSAMSGKYKYPAWVGVGEFDYNYAYTYAADGVTLLGDDSGPVSPAGWAPIESSVALESNLGTLDRSKYGCVYLTYEYGMDTRYIVAGEKVDFVTFYFFTAAGTDVTGAEFGTIGDATKPAGTFETTGDAYYSGAGYVFNDIATVNVSNAVITAPAAPELSISWLKNQIRFNTNKDGKYANSFDYRIVSQVDNFDDVFASVEEGTAKIKDVGFVFTTGAFDVPTAKAQVEGGAVTYSQVKRCYLSNNGNSGANYAFACLVKGIADNDTNKAATLSALGYVIYENASGETAYAYYDTTLDVGALYNANSGYIPA